MSDTKALEYILAAEKQRALLREDSNHWKVEYLDQAAAELKILHEELGLLHDTALRQEQDKRQLRTENADLTRKGLLLCNQNGELLMQRIQLRKDLEAEKNKSDALATLLDKRSKAART